MNLALWICLAARSGKAQQRGQIAITVDDLPTHGLMPPGMTRAQIAKDMVAALKAKGLGHVYGFVNARKMDRTWDKDVVLEIWTNAGFPLGNHTYSHMDITPNSISAFEEDIARNEGTLEGFMGGRDWHWFRYPYLNEGDTLEKGAPSENI